jgi:hypothetical protein
LLNLFKNNDLGRITGMKLKPIVASLALLLGGQAMAAYVPTNPKLERLQAKLDRNQNPYYAQADWFKRISVSGLVQVSAAWAKNTTINDNTDILGGDGVALNRHRFSNNDSSSDVFLSRANVYIDADINEYTEAHVALDLSNQFVATHAVALDDERLWVASSISGGHLFIPDEAYITIGNFAKSPLYFRAGREYLRYGHYERNVVPASLVQLMTQTQADAVELGFVDVSGFNGSAYAFRSEPRNETEINNFGLQIGYVWQNGPMGVDVTADFLYDVSAVNYINSFVSAHTASTRESGVNLSAIGHYEQFDGVAQFTSSLGSYSLSTLTYNGSGAQPMSWLVGLGYTLSLSHNNDSHVGVNYQQTQEALGIHLPRYRVQGDFRWEVWKNTEVGFYLWYDKDYGTGNSSTNDNQAVRSGTGDHNFTGLLSLTARIA